VYGHVLTSVAVPCGTFLRNSGPPSPNTAFITGFMFRPRFVLITPGWTALAVCLVPANRRASSFANSRLANLDWPYAVQGA
jgi:hypothetical protein